MAGIAGSRGVAESAPGISWVPMIEWPTIYHGPPLAVDFDKAYGIPAEDERRTPAYLDVAEIVQTRPAATYAAAALAPHTPLEPLSDSSPPATPIRVPWSRTDQVPNASAPQQPSSSTVISYSPSKEHDSAYFCTVFT